MSLDRDGYTMIRGVLSARAVDELRDAVVDALGGDAAPHRRRRDGALYGVRNLLDVEHVRELATTPEIRRLVAPVLGDAAIAVRGILFDKSRAANWRLGWHQDKAIAVTERHDVDGFGPWSTKAGVVHAHAPEWLLRSMLTVRLHLDDCDASRGALRVLPGTHDRLLSAAALDEQARRIAPVVCAAGAGDALIMRPLLAHASGRCESPGHRRVRPPRVRARAAATAAALARCGRPGGGRPG